MLFLLACRAPQAPEDYENLVAYLLREMSHEQEAYPQAGIENIQAWIETSEEFALIEEGVQVSGLVQEDIEGIEAPEVNLDELAGVSIITRSNYAPVVLSDALTQYSFAEMMPDVYEIYERTFEEGQECISTQECDWAQAQAYTIADWGLLGQVEAQRTIQFR